MEAIVKQALSKVLVAYDLPVNEICQFVGIEAGRERPKSRPPIMAESTHRTELILLFEKIYILAYSFGINVKKYLAYTGA